MASVNVLDTTLRDGGISLGSGFTTDATAEISRALEDAGFHFIEVGHGLGLGAGEKGYGCPAATDEEYLAAARDAIDRARFGMMCLPGIATPDHVSMAADYGMGFIRVGPEVTQIADAEPYIRLAVRLGMFVSANVLKSYTISPARYAEEAQRLEGYGANVVYVVDSAGCMFPDDAVRYIEAVRQVSDIEIGFHAHDNLGMAVYNSLRMVDEGATFVDSSLQGLGRGAGNAVTESLVATLEKRGHETGIDLRRTLCAGYELIRPLGAKGGIEPLDVIAGYAGFHSSHLPTVLRVARRSNIDPALLIIEVCEVDRVQCPESVVEEIADRIGSDSCLDNYLGRYGDSDLVACRPGPSPRHAPAPGERTSPACAADTPHLIIPEERMSDGFLYVATQEVGYVLEACSSARSLRHHLPDVPAVLFTDRSDLLPDSQELFAEVVRIEPGEGLPVTWPLGLLDRVQSLAKTPYEKTVHIDTETRIASEGAREIFDILDDCEIAMVPTAVDTSGSRRLYGRPMFNGGMISYRLTPGVQELFRRWAELTAAHHAMAMDSSPDALPEYLSHVDPIRARRLLAHDQISLERLLSPEVNVLGLEVKVLDESWNWRGGKGGRRPQAPLRINHHPDLRVSPSNLEPYIDWEAATSMSYNVHVNAFSTVHARADGELSVTRQNGEVVVRDGTFSRAKTLLSLEGGAAEAEALNRLLSTGGVVADIAAEVDDLPALRLAKMVEKLQPHVVVT